jgi:hypothetical protein
MTDNGPMTYSTSVKWNALLLISEGAKSHRNASMFLASQTIVIMRYFEEFCILGYKAVQSAESQLRFGGIYSLHFRVDA